MKEEPQTNDNGKNDRTPVEFVDYIIEYSHIYTDDTFGEEHKRSIELLHETERNLDDKGHSHARAILIDNYNPNEHTLSIPEFLDTLTTIEATPDLVVLEQTLTIYSIYLLNKMKYKMRKRYLRYIRSRNKMPCSLLLAVWHTIKLGYLELNYNSILYQGKPYKADKLILILQKRFKEVEDLGRKIFDGSGLSEVNDKIEYIYF